MKYDDYEKVECKNYPNENIVIATGKKYKKSVSINKKKIFDTVYTGVIFMTAFAVIMLISSVITLASSGTLVETFMSVFGK